MLSSNSNDMRQAAQLIQQRLGLQLRPREDWPRIQRVLGSYSTNDLRHSSILSAAWQAIIQELTIGETYFFRDQHLFSLFRSDLLHGLLQRDQPIIWCAGCATGEEAYSLAMLLHELAPERRDVKIIGTDMNMQAIEMARQATYREWSFRNMDPNTRKTYFLKSGDRYQLLPQIRSRVEFRAGNLMEPFSVTGADLILCRNVMLYMEADHRQTVENRLYYALAPGGWLVLGHAEVVHHAPWQTHLFPGVAVYQKAPPKGVSTKTPKPSKTSIQDRYRWAVQAYQREDYAITETILQDMLAEGVENPRPHILMGAILANQNTTAAFSYLENALQQYPFEADAHYLLAMLHLQADQRDPAERALRAALYCQPGHPLSAFVLGNLCVQAGNRARAQNLWQQAIDQATQMDKDAYISDLSSQTAAEFVAMVRSYLGDQI